MQKSNSLTLKLSVLFFILCFSTMVNAQVVDSLKSEQLYPILESAEYHKTIIDGRDSTMFYSGHIKNAIYIDAFSEELLPFLKNYIHSDSLVLYCSNQTRSKKIINALQQMNYAGRILFMQDGINGWKKNEFPIILPCIIDNKNSNNAVDNI